MKAWHTISSKLSMSRQSSLPVNTHHCVLDAKAWISYLPTASSVTPYSRSSLGSAYQIALSVVCSSTGATRGAKWRRERPLDFSGLKLA